MLRFLSERRSLRILAILVTVLACALGVVGGVRASMRHGPEPDQEEHEAVTANQNSTTGSCGVERWSVKTGTDADAGKISLQSTTSTTIASLVALPAPSSLPSNNRIVPAETTVYRLQTTLVEFKLEADSDYHLVLKDTAGHTMIAEIPDPACVGSASPLLTSIDGTWLLEDTHPGAVHFSMEDGDGHPSRWNTLRALRVLRWHDGTAR